MSDNGQLTKEIFNDTSESDSLYGNSLSFLRFMAGASDRISPWWSQARDIELRNFWKDSDHLSGTVNTLRDMLVAIPFQVLPRDAGIRSHIRQADKWTQFLLEQTVSRSNYSSVGWGSFYGPFVEEYHTQDNGAWAAIDGPGRADGPLVGMPSRLIHLDSGQVWRTRSREYPVVFTDTDGQRYKIHRTRLINMTSMASPIAEMYGVGFSAVSRCINITQHMIDIGRYKQEKLGSRPMRALLHIAGGGQREVKALDNLLQKYSAMLDNQGFTRYSKVPIFGSSGELTLLDFASLPDGFNELEATQLAMAVLALAFGVDSRQLAFALGVSGQTKADAEVQHLKMKGKGPGLFIQEFERQVNMKLLPAHLKLEFDYQDDEQDRSRAEIRKIRGEARKLDIESGVTTVEVERQLMVEDGEISRQQYEDLQAPVEQVAVEPVEEPIKPVELPTEEPIDETKETFNPPEAARNNARKVLEWRKKYPNQIRGMTRVGWARASQLASGKPLSLATVKRMASFNRHRQNAEVAPEYKNEPWRDAGYVAFLGWGGKTGIDWAIEVSQANKEKKSLATFRQQLRSQAWQLSTGQIGIYPFTVSLYSALEIEYNNAWNEGAAICGVQPDERTAEEQRRLGQMVSEAKSHVFDLGSWIVEDEPPWLSIVNRLELWQNRYDEVKAQAQVMACADQKLEWQVGNAEHCSTCLYLNGRVMRASRWAELDVWPRDTRPGKLECHGYRCQCKLKPTTKRATSGRLPKLEKR